MKESNFNAASARKSIQATNSQVTHIQAPEKVAENKPAFKPDFSEAQKGPSVPSDRNHLTQPASAQEEAQSKYAVNLNLEFRDDDYDSISFDLKNNSPTESTNIESLAIDDQLSTLVDRNPNAETHNIIESTLLDTQEVSGMDFDIGFSDEEAIG